MSLRSFPKTTTWRHCEMPGVQEVAAPYCNQWYTFVVQTSSLTRFERRKIQTFLEKIEQKLDAFDSIELPSTTTKVNKRNQYDNAKRLCFDASSSPPSQEILTLSRHQEINGGGMTRKPLAFASACAHVGWRSRLSQVR